MPGALDAFRMPKAVSVMGRSSSITNSFVNGIVPARYPSEPACGKCNQSKGNTDWRSWMLGEAKLSPKSRGIADLNERFTEVRTKLHAQMGSARNTPLDIDERDALAGFDPIDRCHEHSSGYRSRGQGASLARAGVGAAGHPNRPTSQHPNGFTALGRTTGPPSSYPPPRRSR